MNAGISADTNVLYPAFCASDPLHDVARVAIEPYFNSPDFYVCEQTLMELYCLLRNPAIHRNPLSAREALGVITAIRSNPDWHIVDIAENANLMRKAWMRAGRDPFAFRRIFDLRLAETLKCYGVETFLTRNTRDFTDCGFKHLINPFA